MRELEDQVGDGPLAWLGGTLGYAVWERRWPTLKLRAMWTALEFGFEAGNRGSHRALAVRIGPRGGGPPVPPHEVSDEVAVGEGVVDVASVAAVEPACEALSALLAGPLAGVVSGDNSAFGLRAGTNLASWRPEDGAPSGLDVLMADADQAALVAAVRAELEARLPWLGESRDALDLTLYGLRHGHPPPAVSATVRHPEGSKVELIQGVIAEDAIEAAEALAPVLEDARGLLLGDPDAWRARRCADGETMARMDLERRLEHDVPEATEAFWARDYDRVVELLDPLDGHLPGGTQHKLEYARRRR